MVKLSMQCLKFLCRRLLRSQQNQTKGHLEFLSCHAFSKFQRFIYILQQKSDCFSKMVPKIDKNDILYCITKCPQSY